MTGKLKKFCWVFLFAWLISPAQAEEIVVGFSYAKPPYVFAQNPMQEGELRGIELEIMRKALAVNGHSFKPKFFTYNKLHAALRDGKVDAIATVRPEKKDVFYSGEFVYFHNFAITSPEVTPPITDIASLSHRTITTWEGAGYDLGPEFQKALKAAKLFREVGDQQKQVFIFLQERVNTIVIDGAIFNYWAKVLGKNPEAYQFHDIFGGKTSFVAGFKSKKMRDDFDAGLNKLKADKTYDKIFKKY